MALILSLAQYIARSILNRYRSAFVRSLERPYIAQQRVFGYLMRRFEHTELGAQFHIRGKTSPQEFAARVPIFRYDDFKPYIKRTMDGQQGVIWPERITLFAKSAGTTSDQSKYIPVSKEYLWGNHLMGSRLALSTLLYFHPEVHVFGGKNLVIPGTFYPYKPNPSIRIGDISAIMTYHMPRVARWFFTPDFDTAFIEDFEEKIERTARLSKGQNVVTIGGVPTWNVVLIRRVLALSGKQHLREVWPNFKAYIHGGVRFEPYREQFRRWIPEGDFVYQEVYNASEGFIAVQDEFPHRGMALMADHGIYYEFVPQEHVDEANPPTLTLEEVEEGKNYAVIMSTAAGLWRYWLGDVVKFVSTRPPRIEVVGRTQQFINVFGEELMVENAEKALAATCEQTGAVVAEYTAGPIYFQEGQPGGHEWIVEFKVAPSDLEDFAQKLDDNLRRVNSDYNAKREGDMALKRLSLTAAPRGTFQRWLKYRGKLGAQAKVPRLSNDRAIIDDILNFIHDEKATP